MSLWHIGQQITIYGGSFIIVAGVIGNGINILVFSSVRTYRTVPCTFYFLISSICNMAFIIINLTSNILNIGYGIDLNRMSTSLCKMLTLFGNVIPLTSLTCSCLATIDQFFVTSQNANLRRLSNIKWAHRIVFIVVIVWLLHGIPMLVFYNISPVTMLCVDTSSTYSMYISIYVIALICAVPVVVMVIFGYLTYRNIHLTRVLAEQQADRQLVRMILIQVLLVVICIVPYGINSIYSLITSGVSKDTNQIIVENFVFIFLLLLIYGYYAVCIFIL
jgi:hypothetical protein